MLHKNLTKSMKPYMYVCLTHCYVWKATDEQYRNLYHWNTAEKDNYNFLYCWNVFEDFSSVNRNVYCIHLAYLGYKNEKSLSEHAYFCL